MYYKKKKVISTQLQYRKGIDKQVRSVICFKKPRVFQLHQNVSHVYYFLRPMTIKI